MNVNIGHNILEVGIINVIKNCLAADPGIKWIPYSDCAPRIILPCKNSRFLYLWKHNFYGSKTRNLS